MSYKEISNRLIENGFECHLVGGAVRSLILNETPNDYDLTTNAKPEEIIDLFKDTNVKKVGISFGVVIINNIEVTTYRFDRNFADGKDNVEVKYADTIYEDLARRDLTINSIALNLETNECIDLFNGVKDLKEGRIKFVGIASERIKEDPCRILRLCRFYASHGKTIDANALISIRKNIDYNFSLIAPERIRIEILKAMKIKNASKFFEALHIIGALKYIFPSLESCYNHEHGNFHKENVWEHSMICGDSISVKFPLLKLTGYLHDCGKPKAFKENNDGSFVNHETIGRNILEKELKHLTFSNYEINYICGLVRCHMYSMKEISGKAVRRMLKKFDEREVSVDDYLRLKIADRKGNLAKADFTFEDIKKYIKTLKNEALEEMPFSVNDLALKGGKIIDIFGLEPGKLIGDIQRFLLTFVIENGIEYNRIDVLVRETCGYLDEHGIKHNSLFDIWLNGINKHIDDMMNNGNLNR